MSKSTQGGSQSTAHGSLEYVGSKTACPRSPLAVHLQPATFKTGLQKSLLCHHQLPSSVVGMGGQRNESLLGDKQN